MSTTVVTSPATIMTNTTANNPTSATPSNAPGNTSSNTSGTAASTGLETSATPGTTTSGTTTAGASEDTQDFSQLIGGMLTAPTATANTTLGSALAATTKSDVAATQTSKNAAQASDAATKKAVGEATTLPDLLAMMLSAKSNATPTDANAATTAAVGGTSAKDTSEDSTQTTDSAAATGIDPYALAYAPLAVMQNISSAAQGKAETPASNAAATGAIGATADSSADNGKSGNAAGARATLLAALTEGTASKQDASALTRPDTGTSAGTEQQVSAGDANINSALQQLAQHSAMHHAPRDSGIEQPHYELRAPLGSRDWNNQLGDQLNLMLSNNTQSASLELTPDNLGPVQVRIEVKNDQATVYFTADHPDTRTALEQSLPRLREMFTAQGMSLTDAGVFGQQSQQQSPPSRFTNESAAQTEQGVEAVTNVSSRLSSLGMLDAYA